MLLLHLLHTFFGHINPLYAIIIDEGIPGYRERAVALAIRQCEKLRVNYSVVKFADEFGLTNTDIANALAVKPELGKGVCGFCGTFRRSILNKYARKLGLGKLATGHNLDDETQSILMNVFDNHFEKFARMGPVAGDGEANGAGLVPRIKPFFETPEKEIIAYCALNGIEHFSENCCPHSKRAKRNDFRKLLNDFEHAYPGTKFSILNFSLLARNRLGEIPSPAMDLEACQSCGEPGNGPLCHACANMKKILDSLKRAQIPLGAKQVPDPDPKKDSGPSCYELKNQAV
jgi:uncharacterized protein (TIGR00269 family)